TDPITPQIIIYIVILLALAGIVAYYFGVKKFKPEFEKISRLIVVVTIVTSWIAIAVLFIYFLNFHSNKIQIELLESLGSILIMIGSIALLPIFYSEDVVSEPVLKRLDAETIQNAIEIEKKLMKQKLWGNPAPEGAQYANLDILLPSAEWARVREEVFKRQKKKCSICKKKEELFVHEEWTYNYKKNKMKLIEIVGLCNHCHLIHGHLEHVRSTLIPKGEVSWDDLAKHWAKINRRKEISFDKHKGMALELWRVRSLINWKLFDKDNKKITTGYIKLKKF
ncbi:MAG: hypothetical protein ACFFCQ_16545, partial [Promethearchaeota archaeon]